MELDGLPRRPRAREGRRRGNRALERVGALHVKGKSGEGAPQRTLRGGIGAPECQLLDLGELAELPLGMVSLACGQRDRRVRAHLGQGGRVFVADVYPDVAFLATLLLKRHGIPARAFDSRLTTWHAFAFANPQPAVLITDEASETITAMELIQLCRAMNPELKILLVTPRPLSDLSILERAVVNDVLPEAYCGPMLAKRVREMLGVRGWQHMDF